MQQQPWRMPSWTLVLVVFYVSGLTLANTLRLPDSPEAASAYDDEDGISVLMMRRRLRRAAPNCGGDCQNGGVCRTISIYPPMPGSTDICVCEMPYTGTYCTSMINYCTTAQPEKGINPPSAPPCLNGGTCTGTIVTDPYFSCSCVPGFTGSRCETNIDDCIGNPCIHGQCTDLVNTYNCSCYRGWEGSNCSVDTDYCASAPCLNGGRCTDGNSTFICDCSAIDYTGDTCNIWNDDCAMKPCQNGGRCTDGVKSYSCDCTDTDFKGTHCDVRIDDCVSNPCVNGATCVDGKRDFSCTCFGGYSGKTCSTDFLDCVPHRCDNGGLCQERSNPALYGRSDLPAPFNGTFSYSLAAGFVCVCPPGAVGPTCSINPNDCLNPSTNLSVCVHASGCTDHLNDFTCHCLPGYDGRNCSNDINECQVFGPPCKNGGTCTDLVADYQCTCTAGFGGKNCSFTTLVSFNGSNSLAVLLGNSSSVGDWMLELTFRSSLIKFDLLGISSDWGFIRIGALNSSLIVQLWNSSSSSSSTASPIGQVSWPIAAQLDSTNWLTLSIVLINGSTTLTPIGSAVSQSEKSIDGLAGKFKPGQLSVHVGGERVSTIEGGRFRGCVRDLRLVTGSSTSVAMETTVKSGNATWGVCNRSPQCSGLAPCQSSSSLTCSDLWNDFVCRCQPSFGGPTCSVQLPSFTLGLAGNVSSATFTSLPAASSVYGNDPHWTIEFSVVTMSPGAFLLLLGDFRDSATTPRLLAVVEPTGRLSAQLLHSNGTQIGRVESPASVAIGSSVYVRIFVSTSRGLLSLTTSSTVRSSSFSRQSSQLSGDLIIGGFSGAAAAPAPAPVSGGRAKRLAAAALASSLASSLPANVTGYRGILSGLRLHEITPLLLGSVGASLIDSLPGALSASDSSEVVTGTGTEKVCAVHAPCKNGATCSDVFYNSYTCQCTIGWRGVTCSQPDHCYAGSASCPIGTQCVNLDSSGFECRTAATFGSSRLQTSLVSQLDLSITGGLSESLATVAGWARTRQPDCQLMSVSSGGRQLSLRCHSGNLQVSLDDQTVLLPVAIATGVPFTFSVSCSASAPLTLGVSVNGSDVITTSSSSPLATGLTLNSVAMVTLGGANFKGCLNNVRLNGHLAPLVNRSTAGAPRFLWSLSSTAHGPLLGCHGDPVCQAVSSVSDDGSSSSVCQNAGRCTDLWNAFECSCTPEFSGATCSNSTAAGLMSGLAAMAVSAVSGAVFALVVALAAFLIVLHRYRQGKLSLGIFERPAETNNLYHVSDYSAKTNLGSSITPGASGGSNVTDDAADCQYDNPTMQHHYGRPVDQDEYMVADSDLVQGSPSHEPVTADGPSDPNYESAGKAAAAEVANGANVGSSSSNNGHYLEADFGAQTVDTPAAPSQARVSSSSVRRVSCSTDDGEYDLLSENLA